MIDNFTFINSRISSLTSRYLLDDVEDKDEGRGVGWVCVYIRVVSFVYVPFSGIFQNYSRTFNRMYTTRGSRDSFL